MRTDEQRIKHAQYMQEYTARNRDKINAQRRERRKKNFYLIRERAWKKANPEKIKEYKKRDRVKRADLYSKWRKEWAERNADKVMLKRISDYQKNKHEICNRLKKFRKENPDIYHKRQAEIARRRRAKLAKVPYEKIDSEAVYKRDGGICGICGKFVQKKEFSIDHIIPISKGGSHTYDNVQTAHLNCNIARGNRPLVKIA